MSTSTMHYLGTPGQTRQENIHYSCSKCGRVYGGQVYCCINLATDPNLATLLAQRELNTLKCPSCATVARPNVPLLYHDPEGQRLVIMLPKGSRHRELPERLRFMGLVKDDAADAADYVINPQVAFGVGGLARLLKEARAARKREMEESSLLAEQEAELVRRQAELDRKEDSQAHMSARSSELELRESELVAKEEDLQAKQEDLVSRRSRLVKEREALAKGWDEQERERESLRALSVELQAKERAFRERNRNASASPPPLPPPSPSSAHPVPDNEETPIDPASVTPPPIPVEAEVPTDGPGGPRELNLDRRPRLEVDAWRVGDQGEYHLYDDGKVFLMAKLDGESLERFTATTPRVMVQLFGFPQGPLPVLVVLPGGDEDPADLQDQSLYFTLNMDEESDQDLLSHLAREFLIYLDLFDEESRPVTSWGLSEPLADNVVDILRRVEVQLDTMGAGQAEYHATVRAYHQLGDERLGRKQHNFSPDSFQELPTPAAVRLALGIVSYWSEPENQDYLILVKSFPAVVWKEIRLRVVKRALEYGLSLTPPLSDFALLERLFSSREDLLRTSVANFAEVSLRIKPSDLDPQQEYENWKMLLSDCAVEGVQVDNEMEELAEGAAKRAKPVEQEEEILDLSVLPDEELIPLLTERDQRRDAALELCERGDLEHLEPVYNAVCNMTRSEVARVLPTLIQFGDPAVPLLIKGLRHRKSYVRQGAALALGQLKAGPGLEPLIDLLLSEPTNVWKEAARAIGEMGPMGLGALISSARAADGDERERIAWAFAHGAMEERGRSEVEAMARGKNAVLAKVTGRALEVVDQVKAHDQEVKGERPMGEQTIVRSFSRQFFEALSGEVSELDDDYILDEEPILSEDGLRELDEDEDEEGELVEGALLAQVDQAEEVLEEDEVEEVLEEDEVEEVLEEDEIEEVLEEDEIEEVLEEVLEEDEVEEVLAAGGGEQESPGEKDDALELLGGAQDEDDFQEDAIDEEEVDEDDIIATESSPSDNVDKK